MEKIEFLNSIKGKKNKYKPYSKSPIRYAGGKSKAVGYIVEQMPDNVDRMMSPFIGGGNVEIACANELDIQVMAYDIFDILVNYWQVQIEYPVPLYETLCVLKPTKKMYEVVKSDLKGHWNYTRRFNNDITLAAFYWFNHNLSYGPGFLGWMSKMYEDENRYNRMIDRVKNFQCDKLQVFQSPFETIIPSYKNWFLYLDPPYYLDGKSKVFKGIYPQRNFPVHHKDFDHLLLKQLLEEHKDRFLLSYNDCPETRELYKNFNIKEVSWQYTLGQGETRIGKNRQDNNSTHVKPSHELLIMNY